MSNAIIQLDTVTKRFGNVTAVQSVSLSINEGETFGLIGTSGSGKTTTLRMINRLIEPTSGNIKINGENVLDHNPVHLRRHIGYMIQSIGLFPHYTIAENVAVVPHLLNWESERIRETVNKHLKLVGLDPEEFGNRYPHELSGGQQQRTGLARALAADPPVILLDEPFAASDPISRRELISEFKKLRERVRKTIVLVTHDIPEAFELCNRMALFDKGLLQQTGTREDLVFRPVNEFVRNFFDSHRLSIEFSIITIGDILPFLITTDQKEHGKIHEFTYSQPVSSVLNKIAMTIDVRGLFGIRNEDGDLMITNTHYLLEAILQFRSKQKGELS